MKDSYERIFLETGLPNPMRHGEPGASADAYPNGLLSERAARWIVRQVRRLMRRAAPE